MGRELGKLHHGHRGVLRARFEKCSERQYRAHFSGTFFKFIPFRYTVTLNAVPDGDQLILSGSSYLGRLVGTFHYQGTASDTCFRADYSSCKDRVVFRLSRVCCGRLVHSPAGSSTGGGFRECAD